MTGHRDTVMEITPDVLLKAYSCGIFPMAEDADDPGLFWVEPELRGVIPLADFHVPRRLARRVRRGDFEFRIDTMFAAVVDACAAPTPTRPSTWINRRIRDLYLALHQRGYAHSVETWQDGVLVGGLYGVEVGGAFCGESMFSRATDASKAALVHLVDRLRTGGFVLLDTQFTNDHLVQFGVEEITREEYSQRLENALQVPADFFAIDA